MSPALVSISGAVRMSTSVQGQPAIEEEEQEQVDDAVLRAFLESGYQRWEDLQVRLSPDTGPGYVTVRWTQRKVRVFVTWVTVGCTGFVRPGCTCCHSGGGGVGRLAHCFCGMERTSKKRENLRKRA